MVCRRSRGRLCGFHRWIPSEIHAAGTLSQTGSGGVRLQNRRCSFDTRLLLFCPLPVGDYGRRRPQLRVPVGRPESMVHRSSGFSDSMEASLLRYCGQGGNRRCAAAKAWCHPNQFIGGVERRGSTVWPSPGRNRKNFVGYRHRRDQIRTSKASPAAFTVGVRRFSLAKAGRAQYRINRSKPARSQASIRTDASSEKPLFS